MVINASDLLINTKKELAAKNAELDSKIAENQGLSSRMATTDRELASLKLKFEQSEKAHKKLEVLAREAEEKEKQSLLAAEERERKHKEEISALQLSIAAAKQQAVGEYLKSPEFETHCAAELLPYYFQGRNHVLRMALADGVAVDQLLSWSLASHYCDRARSQHGVVEFTEDEIVTAQEEDAEYGREPWVPPPVQEININRLIDLIQAGGGAKCDNGRWTLTDPPSGGNEAGPSS